MEYVCIVCPNGCRLTAEPTPGGIVVKGNRCPKGEEYGRNEYSDPRRVVTAVVRTTDPDRPCVPVKSDRPVPVKNIDAVLRQVYGLQVTLPVHRGDICIPGCGGTGISMVYTRTVAPPPAGSTV